MYECNNSVIVGQILTKFGIEEFNKNVRSQFNFLRTWKNLKVPLHEDQHAFL